MKPLFPGTTCFPLSAPKKDKTKYIKIEQEFRAETHQLEKIFEITRVGMDVKLRCTGCGHEVMLPRAKAEKGIKKILEREEKADE